MQKFITSIFLFYLCACSGTNQTLDKYFGYQMQVPIRNTSNILNSEFNKNYDPNIRRRPPENFPFLSNKSTEILTSKSFNKNIAPGDLGKLVIVENQAPVIVPTVVEHKKLIRSDDNFKKSDSNFELKSSKNAPVILYEEKIFPVERTPLPLEEKKITPIKINSNIEKKNETVMKLHDNETNHKYKSLQQALKKDDSLNKDKNIEKVDHLKQDMEHKVQEDQINTAAGEDDIIVDFSDEIDYQKLSSKTKSDEIIRQDTPSQLSTIDTILEEEGLHLTHDDPEESEKNNILNKFVK